MEHYLTRHIQNYSSCSVKSWHLTLSSAYSCKRGNLLFKVYQVEVFQNSGNCMTMLGQHSFTGLSSSPPACKTLQNKLHVKNIFTVLAVQRSTIGSNVCMTHVDLFLKKLSVSILFWSILACKFLNNSKFDTAPETANRKYSTVSYWHAPYQIILSILNTSLL